MVSLINNRAVSRLARGTDRTGVGCAAPPRQQQQQQQHTRMRRRAAPITRCAPPERPLFMLTSHRCPELTLEDIR
jgi:hypothetical protein